MRGLLAELRRRRVFRVAGAYLAAAFIIAQVADVVLLGLGLPRWSVTLVLALLILGFPLAVALAWVFDVTPQGIDRTRSLRSDAKGQPPDRSEANAGYTSVAVLPFVDLSSARDQEHFGDGIAEEILNQLTQRTPLYVASRTSSFALKGRNVDVRKIGRLLGVEAILEGSIRKEGTRLRINAQLVDAAQGNQLWSRRFEREAGDVFSIQDEIAEHVAGALGGPDAAPLEIGARPPPTHNLEAYEHYLRGRQQIHHLRPPALIQSRTMFLRATELDPAYAQAWAGVAEASAYLFMYGGHAEEERRQAEEASLRAVRLAPDLAEARAARGSALASQKRFEEAYVEFEEAIRLNPSLFEAYYYYARTSWLAGDLERSAALFERASEVRPEDYQSLSLLKTVYKGLGRPGDVLRVAERAIEVIERRLAVAPGDERALYMGANSLAHLGHSDRASEWADRAMSIAPPGDLATPYNVACVYVVLGEHERAIAALEGVIAAGGSDRAWVENDADLAPLHGNPRFQALLERMGR